MTTWSIRSCPAPFCAGIYRQELFSSVQGRRGGKSCAGRRSAATPRTARARRAGTTRSTAWQGRTSRSAARYPPLFVPFHRSVCGLCGLCGYSAMSAMSAMPVNSAMSAMPVNSANSAMPAKRVRRGRRRGRRGERRRDPP